jgi:TorA maturation chaperone TorD
MKKAGTPAEKKSAQIADLFSFLAFMTRYPESSFFDKKFLDSLEKVLENLKVVEQQRKIANWRQSSDDILTDCQLEYTRLFINAVPSMIAPPYGSYYLDGDMSLHGKTTEKTHDFYREHGFTLTRDSEPADHLQFELEFLSCLFREEKFEIAEFFLTTLFLPWFEKFYRQASQGTEHPFYTTTLDLIYFFTKEEQ